MATPVPNRATTTTTTTTETERDEAANYIRSLLNKNLRIHTTDGRLFHGQFKCTDPDCNLVLSYTYEYSQPSRKQRVQAEAEAAAAAVRNGSDEVSTVKVDMTSRYLGLVVVPGEHIVKIELEEFASQARAKSIIGPERS